MPKPRCCPDRLQRLAIELFWRCRRLKRESHEVHPGWERLGYGHFSRTYVHRDFPSLVVKLSGPSGAWRGYDIEDCNTDDEGDPSLDAGQTWAQFCRDTKHPNLPDVLFYEQMSRGFAVIIMPRYKGAEVGVYGGRHYKRWRKWSNVLHSNLPAHGWLADVVALASSFNLIIDLHDENIMQDRKGRLIMTDPFAWKRSPEAYQTGWNYYS